MVQVTAIFILVVSFAMLVHDLSTRASDISLGSPYLLFAKFCYCHSKTQVTVRLRQRSTNLEPIKKNVISLKHVKLRVDP